MNTQDSAAQSTSEERPSGLFTRRSCETILSSGNQCQRPTKYAVNMLRTCHRHLHRTILEAGKPNKAGHIFVTVYVWPKTEHGADRLASTDGDG